MENDNAESKKTAENKDSSEDVRVSDSRRSIGDETRNEIYDFMKTESREGRSTFSSTFSKAPESAMSMLPELRIDSGFKAGDSSLPERLRVKDRDAKIEKVDYVSMLKDARFIGMGETHVTTADRDEFIRSVPELAKAGVTHVAIEGLPSDDETSKLLADYGSARTSRPPDQAKIDALRTKVGDLFKEHFSIDGKGADGKGKNPSDLEKEAKMREKHLEMVDAALDAKLTVVGVELKKDIDVHKLAPVLGEMSKDRQADFDKFFDKAETPEAKAEQESARKRLEAHLLAIDPAGGREKMKLLEDAKALGYELKGVPLGLRLTGRIEDEDKESEFSKKFIPAFSKAVSEIRDKEMARVAESILKTEGTKLVMFAGASHFGVDGEKGPTVTERLKGKYTTLTIGFAGGDYPDMIEKEKELKVERDLYSKDVTKEAEHAGLKDRYFALRVPPGSGRGVDFIIHVPRFR